MSKILYIKAEQCIQVSDTNVKLGDVVKLECTDTTVVNRLKTEKLFSINSSPNHRIAVSIMAVIQKIHEVFPELEVQNLGESDFIVGMKPRESSKIIDGMKVFGVCVISFFGAVFAMMTFNEDVSTLDSFRKVYTWVMGTAPLGATILELSYSLGVSVGIIVFFNRIGKKQLTNEPSPVEVEMSGYDKQVYITLIQHAGRKGQEKDVD